jgi:hypothetical protein
VRPELSAIVDQLARASQASGEVTLDAIGEAIGASTITAEEIDAMLSALESKGRRVVTPAGGGGEAHLKAVVGAVRALAPVLGRKATVAEIAEHAKLTASDVRHALMLLRVMQR